MHISTLYFYVNLTVMDGQRGNNNIEAEDDKVFELHSEAIWEIGFTDAETWLSKKYLEVSISYFLNI